MKKQVKRVLAIANTTYQIIVLLYLKESVYQDYEFELVITNKTPLLKSIFVEGKIKRYFAKVYFADSTRIKNKKKGSIQTFWESFVYNRTTKRLLGTDLDYYEQLLYASPIGVDEITKEISKTLIKNNPKIKISRFEDGFGSYTSFSGHIVSTDLGRRMYQRILGFQNMIQENTLYLFEPKLAKEVQGYHLKKIPRDHQTVLEQAKDIFNYKKSHITEKFIFFGQGTKEFIQNVETYQSMVYKIADIVTGDNLIVKRHPRSMWDEFDASIHQLQVEYPWELLESEDSMQEKVLISFSSTACITGKLLYHSNNHVIFLYPLARNSFQVSVDFEEYFKKVASYYSNIHIAKSQEDLLEILRKLC
ncbi:MAG TPA: polysialyltransferase family glycosyltransferase [Lachnospiraceae bacterium]|nr:polysialyltransferase family glycosyltransferase [Lachnospiraceae bacterium]